MAEDHSMETPPTIDDRSCQPNESPHAKDSSRRRPLHEMNHQSTTTRRNKYNDVLTVLQAAPLVWKHDSREDLMPVETLDFDKEREILTDSLRDAEKVGAHIDLVFETATTEALVAFLETNPSDALHFSCHGYPSGLCFEDGAGGTHLVDSERLGELTATASGQLRFVFVSACFSRAAGEAFLKAGVEHVVCCHQDQQLMDDATILFSANFYRALACGKDLQTAFERGQVAVKNSPSITDPETEMRKFLLLPEDANHNVDVFYTNTGRQKSYESENCTHNSAIQSTKSIIPHPPDNFFGREVDIYNVLQSLSRFRLVRITGTAGIGKGSLAAAVCHYVNSRRRCFRMETVIWLPLLSTSNESELMSAFHRVFDLIQNTSLEVTLQGDCEFRRICGVIVDKLYQTNVLLAIDARKFNGELPMSKLSLFLEHLIRATKKVRILIVCNEETQKLWQSPCVEATHEVDTLNFKASALLFGVAAPFVASRRHRKARTPHRLSTLLVQEQNEICKFGDNNLSKRSSKIFRLIGEGSPGRILKAARAINPHDFDELVLLGEREDFSPETTTRAELEEQSMQIERQIDSAVARKDYKTASELQDSLNDFHMLLESLPSLPELKGQRSCLEQKIQVAVSKKDYKMAHQLQEMLGEVVDKLRKEEHACGETNPASEPSYGTRAELEMHIGKLEAETRHATIQGEFAKARCLQRRLKRTEENRKCFPSKLELQGELQTWANALEESLRERNIDAAEILYQLVEDLTGQISREKRAEYRIRSDQADERTTPGAHVVADINAESSTTESREDRERQTEISSAEDDCPNEESEAVTVESCESAAPEVPEPHPLLNGIIDELAADTDTLENEGTREEETEYVGDNEDDGASASTLSVSAHVLGRESLGGEEIMAVPCCAYEDLSVAAEVILDGCSLEGRLQSGFDGHVIFWIFLAVLLCKRSLHTTRSRMQR